MQAHTQRVPSTGVTGTGKGRKSLGGPRILDLAVGKKQPCPKARCLRLS